MSAVGKAAVVLAASAAALVTADTASAQTLRYTRSDVAVGQAPHGVLSTDLNGDRAVDVAVANFSSNTVAVLHNSGAGALDPPSLISVPAGPTDLVSADFNEDAHEDLAVASFGGGRTSILLGGADGRFSLGTSVVTSGPAGLVAEDLDGDGHADMAVVETSTDRLQVFFGAGDGTFTLVASLATGSRPNRVAAGDLDGDGTPDLAVTNLSADSVSIYLNSGSGGFAAAPAVAVGDEPVTPALSDVNGDDHLDLLTANIGDGSVSVAHGEGTGTFEAARGTPVGGSPYTLIAADLNVDGRQDIAATRFSADTVAVLLGNGDGSFGRPFVVPAATGPIGIATGDISGDGHPDLAVSGHRTTQLSVLTSSPRLHVAPTHLSFRMPAGGPVTAPRRIVVSNHAVAPLRFRSIRVSGPGADAFALSADGCSGVTIDAGGSCALGVTARAPSVSRRHLASLVIESNDPSGPTSVPLSLVAYGGFTCRAVGSRVGGVSLVIANGPNSPCVRETEARNALVTRLEAATNQTPSDLSTAWPRLGDGATSSVSLSAATLTVGLVRIEAIGVSAHASFRCARRGHEHEAGGSIRVLEINGQRVPTDAAERHIWLPGLGTLHVNDTHFEGSADASSLQIVRRGLWFDSDLGPQQDQFVAEARAGRERGDPCI